MLALCPVLCTLCNVFYNMRSKSRVLCWQLQKEQKQRSKHDKMVINVEQCLKARGSDEQRQFWYQVIQLVAS